MSWYYYTYIHVNVINNVTQSDLAVLNILTTIVQLVNTHPQSAEIMLALLFNAIKCCYNNNQSVLLYY